MMYSVQNSNFDYKQSNFSKITVFIAARVHCLVSGCQTPHTTKLTFTDTVVTLNLTTSNCTNKSDAKCMLCGRCVYHCFNP